MRKDWFASFRKNSVASNCRATRATWATPAENSQKTGTLGRPEPYMHSGNSRATGATPATNRGVERQRVAHVAHVAHPLPMRATAAASQNIPQKQEDTPPVARVARVALDYKAIRAARAAEKGRLDCRQDRDEWRTLFNERAAIAELGGGLSRPDAEARAYECCIVEWMNQNAPLPTGADTCAHCGKLLGEIGRDALLFLRRGGHIWLHPACYRGWQAHRRAEAVNALRTLGIIDPSTA